MNLVTPPLPPLLMELLVERFTEEASSMSRYSWGMVRGVFAPPVLLLLFPSREWELWGRGRGGGRMLLLLLLLPLLMLPLLPLLLAFPPPRLPPAAAAAEVLVLELGGLGG